MWQNIQGHDAIVERFRRAANRNRLEGSFLFVGPPGVGKRRFAFALAKTLLCKNPQDFIPCETCESCLLFGGAGITDLDFEDKIEIMAEGEDGEEGDGRKKKGGKGKKGGKRGFISPHPDLYYIAKPPDKTDLPKELIVGDNKAQGEPGLCYNISRTPFLGNRKVAIIDDSDHLNRFGANALLKTLEEPPPGAIMILIGTSAATQLPTIRSRCQIVRFAPLSPEIVSAILLEKKIAPSEAQADRWAAQAEGSLDKAKEMADDEVDAERKEMMSFFTASNFTTSKGNSPNHAVALAKKINEWVDAVGKESIAKRRRLRLLLGTVVDHYRRQIPSLEPNSQEIRSVARRLERTLDALTHVDRNAYLPFVIDSWAIDVFR